jgi:hypothetical protein
MPTRTSEQKRLAIGHFSYLLDQCASLLPYIAQYEAEQLYLIWDACGVKFTTDFRALCGFLIAERQRRDAHGEDFLPGWKPTETSACEHLKEVTNFIHKHRAHLSWQRFENQNDGKFGIERWVPAGYLDAGRLTAASYARILTDYLDVLDEFINRLPSKSDGQQLFFGAAFNARHKVNAFMGLPSPSPVLPS